MAAFLIRRMAYGLLTVLGVLLFKLFPFVMSFALSFTQYDIINPPEFVGLDNYRELATQDPLFRKSLGVTLLFAMLAVPLRVGSPPSAWPQWHAPWTDIDRLWALGTPLLVGLPALAALMAVLGYVAVQLMWLTPALQRKRRWARGR